jgi:hypothetical protein
MIIVVIAFGLKSFQSVYDGKINILTSESRFMTDNKVFSPAKAGFQMALGFPDVKMPPNIGEFTFKYREKSRVADATSESGFITKSTSKETMKDNHYCKDREHNWGDESNPV